VVFFPPVDSPPPSPPFCKEGGALDVLEVFEFDVASPWRPVIEGFEFDGTIALRFKMRGGVRKRPGGEIFPVIACYL
jgi:hypothetical protein